MKRFLSLVRFFNTVAATVDVCHGGGGGGPDDDQNGCGGALGDCCSNSFVWHCDSKRRGQRAHTHDRVDGEEDVRFDDLTR